MKGDRAATVMAWGCVGAAYLAAIHDRAAMTAAWGALAFCIVVVRRLTR